MTRVAVKNRATPDVMNAPRKETHSTDFQIGEMPAIGENTPREDVSRATFDPKQFGHRLKRGGKRPGSDVADGNLIMLDSIEVDEDYLKELAFNEEWLTIIIHPSTHKNAATIHEQWNGGIPAEMRMNGKVLQVGALPVDKVIDVKRKIVEQIIRARVTNFQTAHEAPPVEQPRNALIPSTTPFHSFTVLNDPNPRGREWLQMCFARQI